MNETPITVGFLENPAPRLPRANEERMAFAAELRKRPGVPALWGRQATATAARQEAYIIRKGGMKEFLPPGAYESATKTLFGEYLIFVRYVGDEPATAQAVAR